jgi:hypothetical protein
LAFLRKGNTAIAITIVLKVYNAIVKFEIISKSKLFPFLCYKLRLFKLYLFLFSKTFISYKKCIIGLQANNTKRFFAIKKTRIIYELIYK